MSTGLRQGLCPACRWGIVKWVLDLKEINMLGRLQDAIHVALTDGSNQIPSKPLSTYGFQPPPPPGLCHECQDGCEYRIKVAKFMQDEIRKLPSFRSFL